MVFIRFLKNTYDCHIGKTIPGVRCTSGLFLPMCRDRRPRRSCREGVLILKDCPEAATAGKGIVHINDYLAV